MKKGWIALSVTTAEALRLCLSEESPVIAVETPLYPEIKTHWANYMGIEEYELTEYDTIGCVILKKVRGENIFDDRKYDIFYFPFSRL